MVDETSCVMPVGLVIAGAMSVYERQISLWGMADLVKGFVALNACCLLPAGYIFVATGCQTVVADCYLLSFRMGHEESGAEGRFVFERPHAVAGSGAVNRLDGPVDLDIGLGEDRKV